MKITITDIIEWDRDDMNINGDASREGRNNVMPLVYAEETEIKENGWGNLPFTYEVDTDDENEAVEMAIDEYATYHTDYIYHCPTDVDYEIA